MKYTMNKFKIATLATCMVCLNSAHGNDVLVLKVSSHLGQKAVSQSNIAQQSSRSGALLGKIPMFRGVAVDSGMSQASPIKLSRSDYADSESKPRSVISAIYGGLQISFQDNLSLIYAPGRLAGPALNSDSHGLYLLSNRGGLAHWFAGVESKSYVSASDTRRSANTAQFGVLFELD